MENAKAKKKKGIRSGQLREGEYFPNGELSLSDVFYQNVSHVSGMNPVQSEKLFCSFFFVFRVNVGVEYTPGSLLTLS